MCHRIHWMLGVVMVAVIAMSGSAAHRAGERPAQSYRAVESWPKLPDGGKWGRPSQSTSTLTESSIWVFERCGGTTCDGSNLAPI